jgi:hypothetical protein
MIDIAGGEFIAMRSPSSLDSGAFGKKKTTIFVTETRQGQNIIRYGKDEKGETLQPSASFSFSGSLALAVLRHQSRQSSDVDE